MHAALCFPIVDVDQRNSPQPGNGKPRSIRVWLAVAFVLLAVVWQVVRLLLR